MIDRKKKFIKPENIFFKKNSQGTFVLANANDDDMGITELDEAAGEIWEQLIAGKSTEEILSWMIDTYDTPTEEMTSDLDELVSQLVDMGYLVEK